MACLASLPCAKLLACKLPIMPVITARSRSKYLIAVGMASKFSPDVEKCTYM